MKKLLAAVFVALLMAGCGEQAQKEVVEGEVKEKVAQTEAKDDPTVPMAIPCEVCDKKVSKRSTTCPNCGHPTPASVVAFKKEQELARIRVKEEIRLARIRAAVERKRAQDERKRAQEEERRLAPIRAEEERKRLEDARLAMEKMKRLIGKPITVTSVSMEMLWVKPGTFEMGSPSSEKDREDDETLHTVTLTEGYWLGKYEVTQSQWEKVMGSNPSEYKGADRPVEKVSWTDVTSFCAKLTASEQAAGRLPAGMSYQLPTEAQWEYACRAGTKTTFSFGDELTAKDANFDENVDETTDVGKYPANAWGFHDMHGNVFEWCADRYGNYPTGAARDPVGPADGSYRVVRGGSWSGTAGNARSANRLRIGPAFSNSTLGFRLSLRPPASK
jgi:formylglycine-generating enzyme required for sulfatase activity